MPTTRALSRPGRRNARPSRPECEALEARELLSVAVPALAATEGRPFVGTVATFAATDITGPARGASIAWGDGQTTAGTLGTTAGQPSVAGSHTYRVPGTFAVTVTVTGQGASVASGTGSAAVAAVAPVITPRPIVAAAGVTFTGPVASFTDAYPGLTAADYTATINWGDKTADANGTTGAGAVVPDPAGGFDVIGSKLFAGPQAATVTVVVIRNLDGVSAMTTSPAAVTSTSGALTGGIAPATNTGAVLGVTAVNQPTFVGTAPPFALVGVWVRRADQAQFTQVGQAIADAAGHWNLSVGALPDGVYDVGATLQPAAAMPGPLVPLVPGGRLVIDTTPPHPVSATLDPSGSVVVVTLRDGLSGLNPATLLDPTAYALTVRGRFRAYPRLVAPLPTAPVAPSDPASVALVFDGPARAWLRRPGAAIELGSLTDLAGNPLVSRHLDITGAAPAPRLGRFGRRG
jgi:hypothetical protein